MLAAQVEAPPQGGWQDHAGGVRGIRAGLGASGLPPAIDAIGSFSDEAAELLEEAEADALAYLDFPADHRRRIRTNNVQERTNREIKRRTRAAQVFPSMESMIRLVGAVMAEADEDWSTRRRMATMDALEREAPPEPAIDAETRLRAERLVLVAMESAGVAQRAA